jgi:DNA-binding transcriptional LysR family regulator
VKVANLETFVLLARLRHFGQTAARLHTTQPAISARIAQLERELGVRLFERETRNLHLTPAGTEALRVVERILADYDDLKHRLADPQRVTGQIRIGAIDAIVDTWLSPLCERLRQTFPRVDIEIIVDTTLNLVGHMRSGDLDACFCLDPVLEEGHRSFVVCTYAMSWVGSPRLVEADRVYSVAELAELPLIAYQRNTPPYRMIAPYFQDESVLAAGMSNSNSLPTMIRLAVDGFGIAAIPTIVVAREVARGELVGLTVDKPFPPLPFVATFHPRPGTGPAFVAQVAEITRQVAAAYCAGVADDLAWT